MTPTVMIVVVVAFIALIVLSKGKKKKPRDVTKGKTGWRIENSPGMPERPTLEGAGFSFDFPQSGGVHYVQNFSPPTLTPGGQIRVRFNITGGGFTPQQYPDKAALLGLIIQRNGDDLTASGEMRSYRWFSTWALPLAAGDFEATIPLDVAHWGDVFAGKDPTAFAAALRDASNVGFVFGHDSGRGHGVYASEPSRFTLRDFQ